MCISLGVSKNEGKEEQRGTDQEANANGEEATANPIVDGLVPCSMA
jgi:hypothetical protein